MILWVKLACLPNLSISGDNSNSPEQGAALLLVLESNIPKQGAERQPADGQATETDWDQKSTQAFNTPDYFFAK